MHYVGYLGVWPVLQGRSFPSRNVATAIKPEEFRVQSDRDTTPVTPGASSSRQRAFRHVPQPAIPLLSKSPSRPATNKWTRPPPSTSSFPINSASSTGSSQLAASSVHQQTLPEVISHQHQKTRRFPKESRSSYIPAGSSHSHYRSSTKMDQKKIAINVA